MTFWHFTRYHPLPPLHEPTSVHNNEPPPATNKPSPPATNKPLAPSPPATHQPSTSFQAPSVQHHDNPGQLNSTPLDKQLKNITNQQKTHESQLSQAERMVKCSRIDLKAGEAGDNVAVSIPIVDRSRGDPRISLRS